MYVLFLLFCFLVQHATQLTTLIILCIWFLTKVTTKIMQFVRSCVCGIINNKLADKSCNLLSLQHKTVRKTTSLLY